jgi:hypothetical protein
MSTIFIDNLIKNGRKFKLTEFIGLHHACISMGNYDDAVINKSIKVLSELHLNL